MSSVRRIPETAAGSREAARHSVLRARDSRGHVRRRGDVRDSRGHVRHRERARQEKHVRQQRGDRPETVLSAQRELRRETVRPLRAVRQPRHVRQESVRHREPVRGRQERARQEKEECPEIVLSAQRDRLRDVRPEREEHRETVRHVQTAPVVPTDRREAVLLVMEDRAARREAKEEAATTDREGLSEETEKIPAWTI